MKNGEIDPGAIMAELRWQRTALRLLLKHLVHTQALLEVLAQSVLGASESDENAVSARRRHAVLRIALEEQVRAELGIDDPAEPL